MKQEKRTDYRRVKESLLIVYHCSLQDIKGRLRTLQLELRHLQQTSAALVSNSDYFQLLAYEDACRTCFPVHNFVSERALPHGANAHAHHLIRSAQLLKVDIYEDLARVRELRDGGASESIRRALLDSLQTGNTYGKSVGCEEEEPPRTPLLLLSQIINSQSAYDPSKVLFKIVLEQLFSQFVSSTGEMRLLDKDEIGRRIKACFDATISPAINRIEWKGCTEPEKDARRQLVEDQRRSFTSCFEGKMLDLSISRAERFRGLKHIDCKIVSDGDLRYFLFTQAALRQRLRLYAERVGFLQHRLGQYVEQNNPRHAPPTVRRRQENAFTDRFLNELARWSHRDMVLLVRDYWGDKYPYDTLASTFQYWEYNYSSRFSQYVPDVDYEEWRVRMEQAITGDDGVAGIKANGMVVVQQSFWLHDRAALTPVVGHELAHYVIRGTTHGPNLLPQASEVARSGSLGDLVRRVTHVVEAWTAPFTGGKHFRAEILSDLMAATRFGYAFLYAWMLENLDQEDLAFQLADEYQRLDMGMAQERAKHPQYLAPGKVGVPQIYLRGRALQAWLDEVQGGDLRYQKQLREAVNGHLELMLEFICGKSQALVEYWKACGDDIAEQLRSCSAMPGARKFRRAFSGELRSKDDTAGQPVWFARVQNLSPFVREEAAKFLPGDVCRSLHTVTDLPWILEWDECARPEPEEGHDRVSRDPALLYSLAMEDYLLRVDHPQRLLTRPVNSSGDKDPGVLKQRFAALGVIKGSNILKVGDHKDGWTNRLIEARQEMLKTIDERDVRNYELPRDVDRLLDTDELYPDIKQWFGKKMLFARLDLLTISVDEGISRAPIGSVEPGKEEFRYRDHATTTLGETLRAGNSWGLFGLDHLQEHGQRPRSAGVLGRYDRHFLTLDTTRLWDGAWEKLYAPVNGQFGPACHDMKNPQPGELLPCYVTRRRMLKAVNLAGRPQDGLPTGNGDCAIVLVGLHWEGLRIPFLSWLVKNQETCEEGGGGLLPWIREAYLSNGWEDVVLFVRPPLGKEYKWSPEGLAQLSQRIKQIYGQRFVERTETLLPSAIISDLQAAAESPSEGEQFEPRARTAGIHLGYLVRIRGRKSEFETQFFKAASEHLKADAAKVELAHISGLMDYRVGARGISFANALRLYELLLSLQGVARIETSLRFNAKGGHPTDAAQGHSVMFGADASNFR